MRQGNLGAIGARRRRSPQYRIAIGLPILLFAVLVIVLGIGLTRDPDRALPSPLVGQLLPAWELPKLSAPEALVQTTSIGGAFDGELWILNVWASWCLPCRAEIPLLAELTQRTGIPIVGLNYKDHQQDAKFMLSQTGDPYRYSLTDLDGRYGIDLGVYGVPETFIVNRDGVILLKHVGPVTTDTVNRIFMPLLTKSRG